MWRPNCGLLVTVYVVLAVAVALVVITKNAAVVAYLATLLTGLSAVLKVLGGDRKG